MLLAFLYDAHLMPDRLDGVAPGAVFVCAAHLAETRLTFIDGTPTVTAAAGETAWGAVFEIADLSRLHASQEAEGRRPEQGFRAVDRDGNLHETVSYVVTEAGPDTPPSPDQVKAMVAGGRHWGLPPGWVAGLEDLAGRAR